MSRKPRPLARDKVAFRDDRLILIACDDSFAPRQYFDAFEFRRVKVEVVPTTDGTSVAEHVLDRLLAFSCDGDDERWLVLDTDHVTEGRHAAALTRALQRARQARVNIAMSRPCFELWLLLHHVPENEVLHLATASAVAEKLRCSLGSYNKRRLRQEDYLVDRVAEALARAERLDNAAGTGDIPIANASRVYLIWRSILQIAQIDDIPPVLRPLALEIRSSNNSENLPD